VVIDLIKTILRTACNSNRWQRETCMCLSVWRW